MSLFVKINVSVSISLRGELIFAASIPVLFLRLRAANKAFLRVGPDPRNWSGAGENFSGTLNPEEGVWCH
jgi:hypothetical protein